MTENEVTTENEVETETETETASDLWVNVDSVINFHGLKPQHLNLAKEDTAKLEGIVEEWISQSQDLIKHYLNRKYTSQDVPPAVQNVCIRLTSNMISLAIQKRDSPIIRVNDWTIQNVSSDIFTDALKDDLKAFVKDSSTEPNSIGVLAITGRDE